MSIFIIVNIIVLAFNSGLLIAVRFSTAHCVENNI